MSLRSAALAGLLILGAASATVSVPANAATAACGLNCISFMTEKYGVADFLAAGPAPISVFGSTGAGRPVDLSAAGLNASQDWSGQYLGTAAQMAAAGIVTQVVGKTWPQAEAIELSWTPDGRPSGLCLGVAGTAGLGTPVTLQPCGTPFSTVWIKIAKSYLFRYGPLVNGTDTRAFLPYVLTADAPGSQLVTGFLIGTDVRNYAPNQMWATFYGQY